MTTFLSAAAAAPPTRPRWPPIFSDAYHLFWVLRNRFYAHPPHRPPAAARTPLPLPLAHPLNARGGSRSFRPPALVCRARCQFPEVWCQHPTSTTCHREKASVLVKYGIGCISPIPARRCDLHTATRASQWLGKSRPYYHRPSRAWAGASTHLKRVPIP